LGWIITHAFYSSRLWERDLIVWLSGDRFSFRWIALPADTIFFFEISPISQF